MSSFSPFLNPLCVALDVDSEERAISIAQQLKSVAGGFKIGPRLINRSGAKIIQDIAKLGPVFVDCKYFDIPSTMIAAIRSAFEAGASVVTVHAMSGSEALQECAKLEKELNQQRPFRILAVTILTSWGEQSYPPVIENKNSRDNVVKLAKFTQACGLNSVVCSGEELADLASVGVFKLVPGIRLDSNSKDDQKRIMTPKLALQSGANVLVVGRPIVEAQNIKSAAIKFLQEI
jgi:orotidine-5'-phosphate decarboxylase